jgi:hypothetical protein
MWLDMLDDAEPADLAALAVMGSAPERAAALEELARRMLEWESAAPVKAEA